jgi:hypothetical protein
MKPTPQSWDSSFFSLRKKNHEIRDIQYKILHLKSAFVHNFGALPNMLKMPLEDIDKMFPYFTQYKGNLFYSQLLIKEGEGYEVLKCDLSPLIETPKP